MLQARSTNFPFSLVVSSLMLKRTACFQEVEAAYRSRTSWCSRVTTQSDFRKHGFLHIVTDLNWSGNICPTHVSHNVLFTISHVLFALMFLTRGGSSISHVATPNISRKMKYIIQANEWNHFTFKYSRRALSAAETRAGCALTRRCALASAQCKWWEDLPR